MSNKLSGIIGKYAPKIGKVLGFGGIPGADFIGEAIGNLFGTKDPTKIEQMIAKDPALGLKLKELETNKEIELNRIISDQVIALDEGLTTRMGDVNETMRAEVKSDGWFKGGWRPLFGYLLAIDFTIFVIFILMLAWLAVTDKNAEAMTMIPILVSAFTILFGAGFAVVGVNVHSRGVEKLAKAGVVKPGVFQVIKSIIKK